MKKFTSKCIKSLIALGFFAIHLSANAEDFTAELGQYANTTYETAQVDFKLSDVAQAVGTDATTLESAFNAWWEDYFNEDYSLNENRTTDDMFFLVTSEGESNNYTQGTPGGFWVGESGIPEEWNDTLVWYNTIEWSSENDVFTIYFGHYPGITDKTINAQFRLKYGNSTVDFYITYTISPTPDAPTVEGTIKVEDLNIVGSKVIKAEHTINSTYGGTTLSVEVGDMASLFGVSDPAVLSAQITSSNIVYTTVYESDYGFMSDTLSNYYTANTPGFWLRRVLYPQDAGGDAGLISPDLASADYGEDCSIFLESFAYDSNDATITCTLGNYPGTSTISDGDSLNSKIYIVYGDKAYLLEYHVFLSTPPTIPLSDMTKAGETTIETTIYTTYANYGYNTETLDIDSIINAVGADYYSDLTWTGLSDESSLWTGGYTANSGYYFDAETGFVCSYGSGAGIYVEPYSSDYSQLNIGLNSGLQSNAGTTYKAYMYFVYGDKYYIVNVVVNVAEKTYAVTQDQWTIEATFPAVMQMIPDENNYEVTQSAYSLTVDQINSYIGTTDPAMYCDLPEDSCTETSFYGYYSSYECSPAPGIWFGEDGCGQGWGSSPIGICWDSSTGAFTLYNQPGLCSVGDSFSCNMYFVNEDNGKMVLVKFTIQYVEEIVEADVVGTEDILLPIVEDEIIAVDFSVPMGLLGFTDIDDMLTNYHFKGLQSNGLYSSGVNMKITGLSFASDGGYDDYGELCYVMADETGFNVLSYNEVSDDFKVSGSICIDNDANQRYVYNVSFVSKVIYDGIKTVNVSQSQKNGRIYDLGGRLVVNPSKGIYIKDGKKYIVK